jgi:hypothetical protein
MQTSTRTPPIVRAIDGKNAKYLSRNLAPRTGFMLTEISPGKSLKITAWQTSFSVPE